MADEVSYEYSADDKDLGDPYSLFFENANDQCTGGYCTVHETVCSGDALVKGSDFSYIDGGKLFVTLDTAGYTKDICVKCKDFS